jgi:hypothetical protein
VRNGKVSGRGAHQEILASVTIGIERDAEAQAGRNPRVDGRSERSVAEAEPEMQRGGVDVPATTSAFSECG